MRDRATRILKSEQRLEDRYVLSGCLIIACILVFAFAGDGRVGRLTAVALEGVTLVVILRASQAHVRTIRTVSAFTAVALAAVALASSSDGRIARAAPGILAAVLALAGPIVIVQRLRRQTEIAFTTVAGALCIYLLAGLFFASLFWTIGEIGHEPFFVQTTAANGVDFVYYSFVTLTTVGYGDLSARGDPGRMCSILESLFGQLYLVSVVALLVANIGRARRTVRPSNTGDAS